jgi:glycosyltransferase involved in cell wall biosynthesis
MLKMCDAIHFNSSVTETVYRKFVPELKGEVIPITHYGITDKRSQVRVAPEKIRIGFVGSSAPYKGLPELLAAADGLYLSGICNFSIEVFGCDACGNPVCDVNYHGAFTPAEADSVYSNMDLLVVPSVCYETFGFIVSEALSHGVGVIASDMVGAKMLLDEKSVYHTREELCGILKRLLTNPAEIEEMSRKICASDALESVADHSRKTVDFYNRI